MRDGEFEAFFAVLNRGYFPRSSGRQDEKYRLDQSFLTDTAAAKPEIASRHSAG